MYWTGLSNCTGQVYRIVRDRYIKLYWTGIAIVLVCHEGKGRAGPVVTGQSVVTEHTIVISSQTLFQI